MKAAILDGMARELGQSSTRRGALRLFGGVSAVVALSAIGASDLGEPALARRRRRKRGKRGKTGQGTQPQPQVCTPGTFVAQVQVGGNGAIVETPALTLGQKYRFQASGAAALSSQFSFDAEFIFANADPSQGTGVDSGVDAGLSIDDPIVDSDKSPKWGAYNPNHIYETEYIGKGKPAQLRMHDGDYTDNSGSVLVTIRCA